MKQKNGMRSQTPEPSKGSRKVTFDRKEQIFLLIVVLASLLVRLFYHFEMRGSILVQHLQLDEQFHDRWAKSIASGNIIGDGVFFRAPLYPYLLGLVYFVFGALPEIPRLAQHFLGSFMAPLVYILGRSLFDTRTAVIAALLCTFYPVLIYFEGRLLFDFLATLLMMLWLVIAIVMDGNHSWKRYVALGVLFGILCILRPTFLPVALPLFGYVIRQSVNGGVRVVKSALPLTCSFLLPIVLVTAHNFVVGGDIVLVASQGGINFYIGNNEQADGYTSSVPEAGGAAWENRTVEQIAEMSLGHTPKPSEVSAYWYSRGFDFMLRRPLAFLQLTLKKMYLFWSHIELVNNQSYYWYERSSVVLQTIPVGFWLVGPLGLAGAFLAWSVPRSRLLLLFLLTYFIVTISFFVCDRFRLPVVPELCILGGFAITRAYAYIRSKHVKPFILLVILLAATTLVVNTNALQVNTDTGSGEDEVHAFAALESGDFATAAELFGRVASLDKTNSGARVNQGIAFWQMGRIQDAVTALHNGIGGNPYPALINLAHLYFTLHMPDSVHLYADRAIEANPFAPAGYVIAAKNFITARDMYQAEQILLKGRSLCGNDFMVGDFLLAGISMQHGLYAAADSLYANVLYRIKNRKQSTYALQSEKAQFGEELASLYSKTVHARGRAFAIRGQLDSSEVYFHSATVLMPSKAEAWADWGMSLLKLNRIQEADSALRKAVSLDEKNPRLWFNYASVLVRWGKLEQGSYAVSRALALKPDFQEAQELRRLIDSTK